MSIFNERSFQTIVLVLVLLPSIGLLNARSANIDLDAVLEKKQFWYEKTRIVEPKNMIILGDSRSYHALSPTAMNSVLSNLEIHNFAYNGAGLTPLFFEEAEKRLVKKPARRIILLGVTPLSLTPLGAKNEHLRENLGKLKSRTVLTPFIYYLQRFFHRVPFEKWLSKGGVRTAAVIEHRRYSSNGWVGKSWEIPQPEYALLRNEKIFEDNKVSADIIGALFKQTRSWVENGVKVVAFRPPSSVALREFEDLNSGFLEQHFVSYFVKAGGIWIDVPESYQSFDGSHLDKDSAISISVDIAKKIAALGVR